MRQTQITTTTKGSLFLNCTTAETKTGVLLIETFERLFNTRKNGHLVTGAVFLSHVSLHSQFSWVSSKNFTGSHVYFLALQRYSRNHKRVVVAGNLEIKQRPAVAGGSKNNLLHNLQKRISPQLLTPPELWGSFLSEKPTI